MARKRNLNHLDLRKGYQEPPGPQPPDCLRKIAAWLEDARTQAKMPFDVEDWSDWHYLWVRWPLPGAGESSQDEDEDEEREKDVVLRISLSDEFKLQVGFYTPHEEALDESLEFERQIDTSDAARYYDYFYNVVGCGEDSVLLHELDIFETDSALRLREELARVGIEMYCPVSSLGDALPGKP